MLAAGGIGDGRTRAAALTAGADGAWLGTAFLATPETVELHDAHKRLIVESDGSDRMDTNLRHRLRAPMAGDHRRTRPPQSIHRRVVRAWGNAAGPYSGRRPLGGLPSRRRPTRPRHELGPLRPVGVLRRCRPPRCGRDPDNQ
ncbi:nitronate monooxygenase [Streptomyces angustmyceticus]|uniref:nitronate monooxygenase n=1 Tax=Streptomyces angustmyceticus TaxID=285578 RepID=UPI00344E132F